MCASKVNTCSHVYVAIFRCPRCDGPMSSIFGSNRPYSQTELYDRLLSAFCAICAYREEKKGSHAEAIMPIEWTHKIRSVA